VAGARPADVLDEVLDLLDQVLVAHVVELVEHERHRASGLDGPGAGRERVPMGRSQGTAWRVAGPA